MQYISKDGDASWRQVLQCGKNNTGCNYQTLIDGIEMYMYKMICDPLSKNLAHPAFYENRDKTGNWYIDV